MRHAGKAIAVAALAVALVALSSCGDDSDRRLEALRTDPLLTVEVPAARSERRSERKGSIEPRNPAKVRRTFTVPEAQINAVIADLAAAARAGGWDLEPRVPNGFGGSREVAGLDSQLVIRANPTEQQVWFEIYTDDH